MPAKVREKLYGDKQHQLTSPGVPVPQHPCLSSLLPGQPGHREEGAGGLQPSLAGESAPPPTAGLRALVKSNRWNRAWSSWKDRSTGPS